MSTYPAIQAGTKVIIAKGCKALDLHKYTHAVVTDVQELGAEYSHNVRVTLRITTGFKAGKVVSLFARHRNRLLDANVGLNNGNPSHRIEIGRYG